MFRQLLIRCDDVWHLGKNRLHVHAYERVVRRGIPEKLKTLNFVCSFWNQKRNAVDFLLGGDFDYVLEALPTAGTPFVFKKSILTLLAKDNDQKFLKNLAKQKCGAISISSEIIPKLLKLRPKFLFSFFVRAIENNCCSISWTIALLPMSFRASDLETLASTQKLFGFPCGLTAWIIPAVINFLMYVCTWLVFHFLPNFSLIR